MTDQPTPARPMTPNQLRAVVYNIARTYLEVERGLRPPDQLSAFLTRAEYRRHRLAERGRRAASRPVRPPDIGRVRIDTATPERVNASVLVRRDEDRWSALLVDLRQTGRGWRVEKLDRLERLMPREPRQVDIDEEAVERRRRFVEGERRAVETASVAATRRYEQVPDKRVRAAKGLRDDRDRWRTRLEELQAEGTLLDRQRPQVRVPAGESPDDGERSRARSELEAILGPRPDEAHRAEVWDRAEQVLSAYTERWELDPSDALLRGACLDAQENERRDLIQTVSRAVHQLEADTSHDRAFASPEQAIVSLES
jgi:hypothetical protein